MQRIDFVGSIRHREAEPRHELSKLREVGAQVGDHVDPQAQEAAIGRQRHLRRRDIVASLRVADEMFRAIGLPPNRPAKPARGLQNQGIFSIEKDSCAKAAADVVRDDFDACRRDLQHRAGEEVAKQVHALAADMERQSAAFRVERSDRSARLHVIRHDARIHDLNLHRTRGLREGLVCLRLVADIRIEGDIARGSRENPDCVGPKRFNRLSDRWERLPIDRQRLGGVFRGEGRVGDGHRDNVADVMRLVPGHHWIGLQRRLRSVGILDRRQAGKVAEMREIGREIDGLHARRCRCLVSISNGKAGVRMGTAAKVRVERALRRNIRCVAARAPNQSLVFDSPNRLTHAKLHDRHGFRSSIPRVPDP